MKPDDFEGKATRDDFDRKAGTVTLTAPDGTRWILGGVPDWVFDYVERGESIPLDGLPWGVPMKERPKP